MVQTLVLATAITLIIGVAIYRSPLGAAVGNSVTAIGLTIPSYALLGVLVGIVGLGVVPSVILLVFFGIFPILRNVVVGLNGVDKALVESARGMGMSRFATLIRLELPLAWPVIMTERANLRTDADGHRRHRGLCPRSRSRRLHLLGHLPHGRRERDQAPLSPRRSASCFSRSSWTPSQLRHPSHRPEGDPCLNRQPLAAPGSCSRG